MLPVRRRCDGDETRRRIPGGSVLVLLLRLLAWGGGAWGVTGFHPSAPPRRPPPPPRPDPVLPASVPFATTTPTTRTLPTSTTVFNAVLDNNDTDHGNTNKDDTTEKENENNEKDAAAAAATTTTADDGLELLSSSPQSKQEWQQQRLEEGNFNPLTYQHNSNSQSGDGSGLLALRALRMQALTTELLHTLQRCETDSPQVQQQQLQSILETHQEFLLAPLEDPTTVMGPESIYTPDMTRTARYAAYRTSVHARLQNTTNPHARAVLQVMSDYVLACE